MIKNYAVVAWRNLLRNKLHATINILGLSIGLAACLVIFLIVKHELSFNKGFKDANKIYRIHSSFSGVFSGTNRGVPTATVSAIENQFFGIEDASAFHIFSGSVKIPLHKEMKDLGSQNAIVIANQSFFKVFNAYEWISGSPESLEKPFQTVLTESKAKLYFGSANPEDVIGKEIIYRDSLSVTVSGIVKDLTFKTDIDFTDFISYNTIEKSWLKNNIRLDNWNSVNSSSQLFIKIDQNNSLEKIQAQLPILSKLYKEKSTWDAENTFNLQPLSDLHYNSDTGIFDYSRSPAHLPTLAILIIIAIMLLIIGSINFINLETAQAVRRAKEVGVRKVLGSTRSRLIGQFLTESFIITLFAVLLSLPLAEFGINSFTEFIPKGVEINLIEVFPFLLSTVLFIGLMAGLYPAFLLSSYLPAIALKNNAYIGNRSSSGVFVRKSLIVFQFAFAQILIIATLIVGWQVNYLLTKNLGFKKESIVYFNTPWQEDHAKTLVLKNELEKISGITAVSLSDSPPAANGWSSNTVSFKGKGEEIKTSAYLKFGDTNYLDLYGIEILSGKNLSHSDTVKEFLINETLMKSLGFNNPHDVLGQQLEFNKQQFPIIGVVKDFNFMSLHQTIEPVIIANQMSDFTCLNIQLTSKAGVELKDVLSKIETEWTKVYPNEKIEYQFLDETIKNFYETEQRTTKLISTATAMAILISCLGLFGLASYTSIQRTKEIGIRKVLGATANNIIYLLSKEFIILVLVAFVLAAPIAWLAGNQWLQGFAFQVEIEFWLFIITAVCAVAIALITVGYQTLKAANNNPIDSLRTE